MKLDSYLSPHPRYRLLDRIGKGGMGEVFRAQDRLTGLTVALKRVRLSLPVVSLAAPVAERGKTRLGQAPTQGVESVQSAQIPTETVLTTALGAAPQLIGLGHAQSSHGLELAETMAVPPADPALSVCLRPEPTSEFEALRIHLTQEFRTLAGLRHPHIVSVLDYGFDRDHQPYFTMELLEGGNTLDRAAAGQPFPVQVGLLLQILQALTYLHRRGVLHRDLKPGNILVVPSPRGPQVKLLDFGLAVFSQEMRSRSADIAGTIGYIAPEVLVGTRPSEASDLFAVGVMAHEILAGTHPLGAQPTAALMRDFLGNSPIFSEDGRLSDALSTVLRRALCRQPDDRYSDAVVFERELAQAAGLPVPAETAEIRESFLQAATFIARGEELGTLKRALDEAATGRGAVWLVGGESGVGKSRLLDELRTLALVRGTRVVRGQAVSAGGAAYQVWQGALRPLCLDSPLEDLDASVLRAVVPDIATLLDRAVPEPPILDPQNAQLRFLWTVEQLLLAQKEPLLLLLEDLHWAEAASLAVLQRVTRSVVHHPLLIIGSYRHDERPTLIQEVPGAKSLALHRLSSGELTLLSISMLGEAGRRPEVVSLLERETEGNAFFIVEVLRALAEEVGTLGGIGSGRIPSQVAAGGVQAVLARRLQHIPERTRPFLCAAAVLGRELDLKVLKALPEDVSTQVEKGLADCFGASVLEVIENRWRFTHDKLREAILAELSSDARAGWHHQIGVALEKTYAANLDPQAAALGHHFDRAGKSALALPYFLRAGELATQNGAVSEAINHLERAMELQKEVVVTQRERGHALGLLCRAYYAAGRPEESMQIVERLHADAGFSVPHSSFGVTRGIVRLAAEHVWFRLRTRTPSRHEMLKDIAWTAEVVDTQEFVGDAVVTTRSLGRSIQIVLVMLVLAERLGDPVVMATPYASIGYILLATPFRWLVDDYLREAREFLAESRNPPLATQSFVRMVELVVYSSSADWEKASRCLDDQLEATQGAGDWSHELLNLFLGSANALWQGDGKAWRDFSARMNALARKVDSPQYLFWSQHYHMVQAVRRGAFGCAADLLGEAETHQSRAQDRLVSIFWRAWSALCALRRGNTRQAALHAEATLHLLLVRAPFGYALHEGIAPLVEVYFTLWCAASDAQEQAELHLRLAKSLSWLRTWAAMFPISRPLAFLWHGRYAARRGALRTAGWLLRLSLQAAMRCRMPFEQALAHQALADLAKARGDLVTSSIERRAALELFEQLGASWYVEQIQGKDAREKH